MPEATIFALNAMWSLITLESLAENTGSSKKLKNADFEVRSYFIEERRRDLLSTSASLLSELAKSVSVEIKSIPEVILEKGSLKKKSVSPDCTQSALNKILRLRLTQTTTLSDPSASSQALVTAPASS